MLSFVIKHSLVFMFVAAIAGFLMPQYSLSFFPFLPYVLFSLMVLTLLSMKPSALLRMLVKPLVWQYACYHSFGLMALCIGASLLLGATDELVLAIGAVAATGSLFATPAIIRVLGFDVLMAMAMTIASTLLLPIAIYLLLCVTHSDGMALDIQSYCLRLVIFIFGPMLLSFLLHRFVRPEKVSRFLLTVSPYTVLLVFAFPFGLIGEFRLMWDRSPMLAYQYLAIATMLCGCFFISGFFLYRVKGVELAFVAAVASGNRNVLLTYTIAGSLLGPAFLPLAGAIQAPTYLLPVMAKWLAKKVK
ncbi:hypothetical protein [Marinomonas algicola]|uniref:hypothetical protein n=1 Tax=Marinomonas algicola TaxID=2773454 RepID=UPI001748CB98|nr:hypothetical protein [Marinomonas algicola]